MTTPDQPAQSEGPTYGYEPEYWDQLPDEAKDDIRNSAGLDSPYNEYELDGLA